MTLQLVSMFCCVLKLRVCVFTVWLGCTPEQLWSLAVDPSGQRGDTDTQYLLSTLSSTDTDTVTSDNNLWADNGWQEIKSKSHFF